LKYSIIIPTLNEEKLLPDLLESLNSAKKGNNFDFEIIIADGGSKDSTIEIAKKFCCKILLHANGEIRTISSGRAKGAIAASGEILIFINADVRIDITGLLQIVEERFLHQNYVALTPKIKVFSEEENKKDRCMSAFLNSYFRFLNILGLGMGRGECQVIRKEVYFRCGGYNIDLYAGEDFELFTRIRREGKILFIKDFSVFESPRRYRKWGYSRLMGAWFLNSSASLIFKKSFSNSWELVR
jgi:glycosyltransferase involved in cell wall biosynthesis